SNTSPHSKLTLTPSERWYRLGSLTTPYITRSNPIVANRAPIGNRISRPIYAPTRTEDSAIPSARQRLRQKMPGAGTTASVSRWGARSGSTQGQQALFHRAGASVHL